MTSVPGPITSCGSTPSIVSGLPALPSPTIRPSLTPMSALTMPSTGSMTIDVGDHQVERALGAGRAGSGPCRRGSSCRRRRRPPRRARRGRARPRRPGRCRPGGRGRRRSGRRGGRSGHARSASVPSSGTLSSGASAPRKPVLAGSGEGAFERRRGRRPPAPRSRSPVARRRSRPAAPRARRPARSARPCRPGCRGACRTPPFGRTRARGSPRRSGSASRPGPAGRRCSLTRTEAVGRPAFSSISPSGTM